MTVVIAGCGDLGTQIGLLFANQGRVVYGIRRSPQKLPAGITGIRSDLSEQVPAFPPETDTVVMAITADRRSEQAYRCTYVESLRHVLDGMQLSNVRPRRMLLVSSTSVYGRRTGVVDESTPVHPSSATAAVLLDAESVLQERMPDAVVLRLAGLYGPGRTRLIERVRAGTDLADGRDRYTNRIHRDDAAAAAVHLTTVVEDPAPLYLGVDNEPTTRSAVRAFLEEQLGVTTPEGSPPVAPESLGKRCSNARLLSTGFRLRYPSFREGYRAVLTGHGTRHP